MRITRHFGDYRGVKKGPIYTIKFDGRGIFRHELFDKSFVRCAQAMRDGVILSRKMIATRRRGRSKEKESFLRRMTFFSRSVVEKRKTGGGEKKKKGMGRSAWPMTALEIGIASFRFRRGTGDCAVCWTRSVTFCLSLSLLFPFLFFFVFEFALTTLTYDRRNYVILWQLYNDVLPRKATGISSIYIYMYVYKYIHIYTYLYMYVFIYIHI